MNIEPDPVTYLYQVVDQIFADPAKARSELRTIWAARLAQPRDDRGAEVTHLLLALIAVADRLLERPAA